MNKGRVKWYNEATGFGYIKSQEGREIFVHRSGLVSPFIGLTPDQEVVFDIKQVDKGDVAFNVK